MNVRFTIDGGSRSWDHEGEFADLNAAKKHIQGRCSVGYPLGMIAYLYVDGRRLVYGAHITLQGVGEWTEMVNGKLVRSEEV